MGHKLNNPSSNPNHKIIFFLLHSKVNMADNSRRETDGVQKDNTETVTCMLASYKTEKIIFKLPSCS